MSHEAVDLVDNVDADRAFSTEIINLKVLSDSVKQAEIKRKIEEVQEARRFKDEYGDLDDWG